MSESLAALADRCVMCGLCLPHCPTFAVSGLETQSPRGRIALAKRIEIGVPVDDSTIESLDSCLQCRRCETVCPAGVEYGEIIERTARRLPRSRLPWRLRLLRRMVRAPGGLSRALQAAASVRGCVPAREGRWLERVGPPVPVVPGGPEKTQLYVGCLARTLEASAQRAVLSIAERLGAPITAALLPCCGALDRHLGFDPPAQTQPQRLIALDSGCIQSLRSAGHQVDEWCAWMMKDTARWRLRIHAVPLHVALWTPCSHAASAAPTLLGAMGMTISPLRGLGCCGAAGPNVLSHTALADRLAAPIIDELRQLAVSTLVTTNVGCAQHLRERLLAAKLDVAVRHPAELFLEAMH